MVRIVHSEGTTLPRGMLNIEDITAPKEQLVLSSKQGQSHPLAEAFQPDDPKEMRGNWGEILEKAKEHEVVFRLDEDAQILKLNVGEDDIPTLTWEALQKQEQAQERVLVDA